MSIAAYCTVFVLLLCLLTTFRLLLALTVGPERGKRNSCENSNSIDKGNNR